jgi:hypothetical protein
MDHLAIIIIIAVLVLVIVAWGWAVWLANKPFDRSR